MKMDRKGKSFQKNLSLAKVTALKDLRKFIVFCLVLLTIFSVSNPAFASTTNNPYLSSKINADTYQEPATPTATPMLAGSPTPAPVESTVTATNLPSTQTIDATQTPQPSTSTLTNTPELPTATPIVPTAMPTSTLANTVEPPTVTTTQTLVAPITITPTPTSVNLSAQASAYYVSTTGSDSNPGTLSQPWKTIQKAANTITAGDTVYIHGGVYHEAVDFSHSGTSSAIITILAYPGETPVLDGNNYSIPSVAGTPLLKLSGNYIYVSGLEVRYSGSMGVALTGTHDTADNINAHHNNNQGILIVGDYDTAQNSRVWSNSMYNVNGSGPSNASGLTAARHPNYAVIKNNAVYDNWGEGLSTYEANGTTIEDNIVYDNWSVNLYISDATNVLCQRNFVYATGAMNGHGASQTGIGMWDEVYNPRSANIKVLNNIVYGTDRNLWWGKGSRSDIGMNNVLIANNTFVNSITSFGVQLNSSAYHHNVTFENNIVEQDGSLPVIYAISNPELHFSNNLWSKTPPSSASGPGDVVGDPKLVKTGQPYVSEWFKLANSSPAIDKAIPIPNVTVDFFSDSRGNAPDIGADEYNK